MAKYLPDCPSADKFTIRHLLTHTSGITPGEGGTLQFVPGERVDYSNYGYQLLGRIIEKVSGFSYEQFLRSSIFAPLGMTNSGYDHQEAILRHRASGYVAGSEGQFRNAGCIDMSGPFSAGGLYSTVEDLFVLDQALWTEKLLKRETIEAAFTPVKLTDNRQGAYGFGWMLNRFRGLREVAHGGDIEGFNTYLARYPDQKFTVIVLSNLAMRPPGKLPTAGELARLITGIYLGGSMEPEAEDKEVALEAKHLDRMVGVYASRLPSKYSSTLGRR